MSSVDANKRIVDLGCGLNKQPGAWGIDLCGDQADQKFDLEKFPWPLPDSQFIVVYAFQVLEHLEDRVRTMEEIYRVCRHGAMVYITVPDGFCPGYVQDPTHKSPWNIGTFLYFCPSQFMTGDIMPPYTFKANFEMLYYHTEVKTGTTPWGAKLYADNLTVILQAIKSK